jgi:hypothetical protein
VDLDAGGDEGMSGLEKGAPAEIKRQNKDPFFTLIDCPGDAKASSMHIPPPILEFSS